MRRVSHAGYITSLVETAMVKHEKEVDTKIIAKEEYEILKKLM